MQGRVLIIAGSDSGGGAGIQADIKTVTALKGFAMTAITAVTAQNTLGVQGIFPLLPIQVTQQIQSVMDDIGADVIKVGMLGQVEIVENVAQKLEKYPHIPIILDPVMLAKGGNALLEEPAVKILLKKLVPQAHLLTPNIPEAEALTGLSSITTLDDMRQAATHLRRMGAKNILLKGGHLPGDDLTDFLLLENGAERFYHGKRIPTRHTHGTGCTLASAIATGLSQAMSLPDSIARARDYLQKAIEAAPQYGQGAGPLNHAISGIS